MAGPLAEQHRPLLLGVGDDLSEFKKAARTVTVKTAMRHKETKEAILRTAAQGGDSLIKAAVDSTVNALVRNIVRTAVTPAGERPTHPDKLTTLWNRLLRTHFLNPEVIQAAQQYHHYNLTRGSYNFLLRNLDLVSKETDNPEFRTLLQYFLNELAHQDESTPLRTPADLHQAVGQILDIPPEQRKYTHLIIRNSWSYGCRRNKAMRAACRAMTEADIPPEHDAAPYAATLEHLTVLEQGPAAWHQWISALRQYAVDSDIPALTKTTDMLAASTASTPNTEVNHTTPTDSHLTRVLKHINGPASQDITTNTPLGPQSTRSKRGTQQSSKH